MAKNVLKVAFRFVCILLIVVSCEKITDIQVDDESPQDSGHETASDYDWSGSGIVNIKLKGNSVEIDSLGATANGCIVTVTSPGTYRITGSLTDGQLIVNTPDSGVVRLLFNGINVNCSSSAPLYIKNSGKTLIVLEENTDNYLTDGLSYNVNSAQEPNAAIFSKSYISFYGNGSLTVSAKYKDGISGKDGLLIKSGKINVTAPDDGIRGKDYIIIHSGDITVKAGGDGLKSDNVSETDSGYVSIETGKFNITSGLSGIHSKSELSIKGGIYNITTSGAVILTASGSGFETTYSSGLKSNGNILIESADLTVSSTGQGGRGIQAGKNINFVSGDLKITTTGAGATYKNSSGVNDVSYAACLKADGNINIIGTSAILSSSGSAGRGICSGGIINIGNAGSSPVVSVNTTGGKIQVAGNSSFEAKAIKGTGPVTINKGTITISSADDGIKSEASITINDGTVSVTKSTEGMEAPEITVNNGNVSIVATDDGFNATKGLVAGGSESNDGSILTINGGNIAVSASGGDGIDSNGNLAITGGRILVHGPQSAPEVGMDVNGSSNVSGGLLVISGTNSNMTQAPSTTSAQYSVKMVSSSNISSTTLFRLQDASGNDIATFKPARNYYSMIISSPLLKNGSTYYIYNGGTSTGINTDGLFTGGTYSGGTQKKSFTISSKVTSVTF